jgi:hypothetical protein
MSEATVENKIPHGYVINQRGALACKKCGHPEKCHVSPGWLGPNETAPRSTCVEYEQRCACA